MKKIILSLIFTVSVVASFAQSGAQQFSGVFYRVNDSTTYQTAAAAKHSAGYADIYFNNQATQPHFDVWNGSSYDHIFNFASGGGSFTLTDGNLTTANGTAVDQGGTQTGDIQEDYAGFNKRGTGDYLRFTQQDNTGGFGFPLWGRSIFGNDDATISDTVETATHRGVTKINAEVIEHYVEDKSTGEVDMYQVSTGESKLIHIDASANQTKLGVKENGFVVELEGSNTGSDGDVIKKVAGVWTIAPDGGGGIDGSGTTNELPFWVDSNTLGSLTTATYPSLSELTTVKGVTSPIQTQLNTKITGPSNSFGFLENNGSGTFRYAGNSSRVLTSAGDTDQTDNGNIIYLNNSSTFALTVDPLTTGTKVELINKGTAAVTFTNGLGVISVGATSIEAGQTGVIIYETGTAPRIIVAENAFWKLTGTSTVASPTIGQMAATSGVPTFLNFVGAAHTGLTTTAELLDVNFDLSRIVTHAAGTIALNRSAVISGPTHAFASASTITTAATLQINPPVVGTNATITNRLGLWVNGGVTQLGATIQSGYNGSLSVSAGSSNRVATLGYIDISDSGTQPGFTGIGLSAVAANRRLGIFGGNNSSASDTEGILLTSGGLTASRSGATLSTAKVTLPTLSGSFTSTNYSILTIEGTYPTLGSPVTNFYGLNINSIGAGNATNNIAINTNANAGRVNFGSHVQFAGALMPNNDPGTSGQVLTSAGAGVVPTWTNQGARTLNVNTSQVALSTTSETDLYRYSVPASTLATDGNSIEATFSGAYSNSGNSKVIRVYFGATEIFDSGNLINSVGTNHWKLEVQVIRTGAATQKCNVVLTSSAGVSIPLLVSYSAAAETLSGALDLAVTGQSSAAAPEITKETGKTILVQ